MGKGFGIAALVLVLLSYPIPFVGPYVAFVGLLCAAAAGFFGEKPLTIASCVLAGIKLFLITPFWMFTMKQNFGALAVTVLLLGLPLVLMFFSQTPEPSSKN